MTEGKAFQWTVFLIGTAVLLWQTWVTQCALNDSRRESIDSAASANFARKQIEASNALTTMFVANILDEMKAANTTAQDSLNTTKANLAASGRATLRVLEWSKGNTPPVIGQVTQIAVTLENAGGTAKAVSYCAHYAYPKDFERWEMDHDCKEALTPNRRVFRPGYGDLVHGETITIEGKDSGRLTEPGYTAITAGGKSHYLFGWVKFSGPGVVCYKTFCRQLARGEVIQCVNAPQGANEEDCDTDSTQARP